MSDKLTKESIERMYEEHADKIAPRSTTGEWTADHVRSLLETTPMAMRDEVLACAINAALAAERVKLESVIDDEIAKNNELREQLAAAEISADAERERREALTSIYDETALQLTEAREQLAVANQVAQMKEAK